MRNSVYLRENLPAQIRIVIFLKPQCVLIWPLIRITENCHPLYQGLVWQGLLGFAGPLSSECVINDNVVLQTILSELWGDQHYSGLGFEYAKMPDT